MIIAVDFDGTIVRHDFPRIGAEAPNAFKVLRKLQEGGHKLILLTMRSEKYLQDAVDFCMERGVRFWAVNNNPEQGSWTSSPKVYAQLYIDDMALGVPMNDGTVDWYVVEQWLYGGALDTSYKHVIHAKEER
jgi:hydroxymethylpyrimidine pyrophosphatase-like HAD family hydrolase